MIQSNFIITMVITQSYLVEFIFIISGVRFGDTLVALANFTQILHPINKITLHIEEKLPLLQKVGVFKFTQMQYDGSSHNL